MNMKKIMIIVSLSLFMLTGCGERKTKEVSYMEETQKIVVMKGSAVWKEFTDETRIVSLETLLQQAKRAEAMFSLSQAEYKVIVFKQKKQEELFLWLHNESRQGWMVKEGEETSLYRFSKETTKQLIDLIDPHPATNSSGSTKVKSITKQDLQITKFHITSDQDHIQYTVFYTISDSLYNMLEKEKSYYFQLEIPEKVQPVLLQEKSRLILGEKVESGYKTYEVHFSVKKPANMTSSQEQAILKYYEGYNLSIWNEKKEETGRFFNIIQFVKEYGEKMERQK